MSQEPGQWSLPLWLGWFPASAASVAIAASIAGISWFWTVDNYHAGMVARRLNPAANLTKPLPEGVEPGPTQWWRTSASHLLVWAQYFDRSENDPVRVAEARALIQRASEISPLSATVRHALVTAKVDEKGDRFALARAVGQSRDIITLTHAGRELLRAGKTEPAREAYRTALAMASKSKLDQLASPILEGSQIRRYALPTEELLEGVIRDMASQQSWSFRDWKATLPKRSAAPLVAARVLMELRSPDANSALDLALEDPISEKTILSSSRDETVRSAVLLAAEAETLALKEKYKEALECYHAAIDLNPIDDVRRSWWLNVAELSSRLHQDSDRKNALELAKSVDPKDEITRYAIDLQKDAGDLVTRAASKSKNDPETRAASTATH